MKEVDGSTFIVTLASKGSLHARLPGVKQIVKLRSMRRFVIEVPERGFQGPELSDFAPAVRIY